MYVFKKPVSIIVALYFLTLAGCASVVSHPVTVDTLPASESRVDKQDYLEKNYLIAPGNLLGIKFFHTPDLNEEVAVRPDGKISLQLIHDIMAAGLTPEQLTAKLKKAYRRQLRNPEIAVIVRSLANQVYVDGEVGNPGMLTLEGPTTVMQAIASAGGITDRSKMKEVIVIRRRPEKTIVITANLDAVIRGKDTRQDISLLPSDIVYVPLTPIANVNVWVDQYIRKNIPLPFFNFK